MTRVSGDCDGVQWPQALYRVLVTLNLGILLWKSEDKRDLPPTKACLPSSEIGETRSQTPITIINTASINIYDPIQTILPIHPALRAKPDTASRRDPMVTSICRDQVRGLKVGNGGTTAPRYDITRGWRRA
ncbi:hypothetical protein V493_00895 [Pseudogymnoascus sp. VKM F-4281 (FW-2241)]|nr:hypothetical protein V493_00895 [Pseudogymnoascus sp. VKM F-4281 (FW-2241)]